MLLAATAVTVEESVPGVVVSRRTGQGHRAAIVQNALLRDTLHNVVVMWRCAGVLRARWLQGCERR